MLLLLSLGSCHGRIGEEFFPWSAGTMLLRFFASHLTFESSAAVLDEARDALHRGWLLSGLGRARLLLFARHGTVSLGVVESTRVASCQHVQWQDPCQPRPKLDVTRRGLYGRKQPGCVGNQSLEGLQFRTKPHEWLSTRNCGLWVRVHLRLCFCHEREGGSDVVQLLSLPDRTFARKSKYGWWLRDLQSGAGDWWKRCKRGGCGYVLNCVSRRAVDARDCAW